MEKAKASVSKSWQIGLIKITEWEKEGSSGKYYQYALSKTEYTKPSGADTKGIYTNLFNLGLGQKEDIVIVKFLLENRRKDNITLGDYELSYDDKSKYFVLAKYYVDKDGTSQALKAPLTTSDILCLIELCSIFILESLLRKYVRKFSSSSNKFDVNDDSFITEVSAADSDILIGDDLPF